MTRICFASPLARPVLDPQFSCDFGGAEVRAVNFAVGLAARDNFEVSMVLRSHRREPSRNIAGVRAFFERTPAPIPRTRDIKRDQWFLWNLAAAKVRKLGQSVQKKGRRRGRTTPRSLPFYSRIPTDVLCVFGVHHYAANIIETARQTNKRSILFLASEVDLDARYNSDMLNDYQQQSDMCLFALQSADRIVAQTEHQRTLLQQRFGRSSTLIRNPIARRRERGDSCRPVRHDYVLWVGRAETSFKRADKLLQLARMCPTVQFVAIFNKRDETTFASLMRSVPDNVVVIEHVPFGSIDAYFRHATALLNTSDAEGFPNAFLQAGTHGVPILSLSVNPDDMLTQHRCGAYAAGDLMAMSRIIDRFWHERNGSVRRQLSDAISAYVRTYHNLDERVEELQKLVLEMEGDDERRKAA